MDDELKKKIEEQGVKIDAIYKSVEQTRKYFRLTMWITVIVFILPLVGLIFVIPSFISSYTAALNGISN